MNIDSVNVDYLNTYYGTELGPWRSKWEKKVDFLSNFSVENTDASKPFLREYTSLLFKRFSVYDVVMSLSLRVRYTGERGPLSACGRLWEGLFSERILEVIHLETNSVSQTESKDFRTSPWNVTYENLSLYLKETSSVIVMSK